MSHVPFKYIQYLFLYLLIHSIQTVVQDSNTYHKLTRNKRQSNTCSSDQFSCKSNQCVDQSVLCDGIKDCIDGSDETVELCKDTRCPKYGFRCLYGACIDGSAKCDGRVDCADKSDETHADCPPFVIPEISNSCRADEFACLSSGVCINSNSLCDGISDCADGSDETGQLCQNIMCPKFSFRCDYGACVDGSYRCDGKIQCPDGSDESSRICIVTSKPTSKPTQKPTTKSTHKPVSKPTTESPGTETSSIRPVLSEGSCPIPVQSEDTKYLLDCSGEFKTPCARYTVTRAPQLSTLTLKCNPGYALQEGTSNRSVCLDGAWLPNIEPCKRICEKLNPINVDLDCYRKGYSLDCEGTLLAGTKVRPRCKPLYRPRSDYPPDYNEITCQENGRWNYILFSCVPQCGVPYTNVTTLIIHGTRANYGDSPWHIAIYTKVDKVLICGGTIITPNLVLSAAHCFHDKVNDKPFDASLFEIVVSKMTRNYTEKDNDFQQVYKVKEIRYSNKGYHGELTYFASDIALLILSEKITLRPTVLPACVDWLLTEPFSPDEGTPGKIVGWGVDDSGNEAGSSILLAAFLPFISNARCLKTAPKSFQTFITPDKFCAGSETGAGASKGDSGGGLMFRSNSLYFIRGIVSIKDKSSESSVAVFTDLSSHINWISSVRNEIESQTLQTETKVKFKTK